MQKSLLGPGIIAASLICFAQMAVAQENSRTQDVPKTQSSIRRYQIPAGPLATALNRFADESGIALVYPASLAAGLSTRGVSGDLTARAALERLLGDTGLTFRFTNSGTVVIEKASSAEGARVLGPVRVEGATGGRTGLAGVNGSTDPTATEGTGSYTSSALSVASKAPLSLRETPQSVSVITQEQMRDQNILDFGSLMKRATGITTVQGSSGSLSESYYSRGFAISKIQIDGGAPLTLSPPTILGNAFNGFYAYVPSVSNMAMFDHAEILRGADGAFNGYGEPGGVVNLSRKRPLDHAQTLVEAAVGSWNNYRVMVDATAPLGFDDRLRGRAVVSYQDQNYFYDVASNSNTLVYGILEGDVTPGLVASVGLSLTRLDAVPWINGLPRFDTGDDLSLSRSASFALPWNRYVNEGKEVFGQIEQKLGADWSVKLKVTRISQSRTSKYAYESGTVNPVTLRGPVLAASMGVSASTQSMVDLTANGSFELFGHRQYVVLGANYDEDGGGGHVKSYSNLIPSNYVSPLGTVGPPPIDVFHFDPNSSMYAEPASGYLSQDFNNLGQKQAGVYANVRLTLLEPLHFMTSLHYNYYKDFSQSQGYNAAGQVTRVDQQAHHVAHDFSWPPTYAFTYDISKQFSAYASYTDVYHSQAAQVTQSGQSLEPITGSNVEGGLKFEAPGGRLNASLAVYRIEQKNYGIRNGNGPYESTGGLLPDGWHVCCYFIGNRNNVSQGSDLEVGGEVSRGWQISGGYTFNENEVRGSDAYSGNPDTPTRPTISLAPKHLLKLWSSYKFQGSEWLHRLSMSGGVNAQTSSYQAGSVCVDYNLGTDANGNPTATCKPGANKPYEFTQGFYAVFSGRLAYQIDKRWNAALNIENLADRRYYQTVSSSSGGNWYGAPRSYTLTFHGNF
ncbi:MAG: TonB-dependent siderophore receptor [Gammaproteobacteria bacterium]